MLQPVNTAVLEALAAKQVEGGARAGVEVELDEMCSFVGNKDAARWLWHAITHHTGCVVAYRFADNGPAAQVIIRLRRVHIDTDVLTTLGTLNSHV
jgi:IS1 transposase